MSSLTSVFEVIKLFSCSTQLRVIKISIIISQPKHILCCRCSKVDDSFEQPNICLNQWGKNNCIFKLKICCLLNSIYEFVLAFLLVYSKTCVKRPLKTKQNKALNGNGSLMNVKKYCRMLPLEHSAILLTCIKRQLVLKTILCLFESGCSTQALLYMCMFFCHLFLVPMVRLTLRYNLPAIMICTFLHVKSFRYVDAHRNLKFFASFTK